MKYVARSLALIWAGFWTVVFAAESVAWQTPLDRMASWMAVGLLFIALALMAWRWEEAGGWLLVTAGLVAAGAYAYSGPRELAPAVWTATLLAFGVPPVLAGALFVMHHRGIAHHTLHRAADGNTGSSGYRRSRL